MTVSDLVRLLGGTHATARAFFTSPQAVSNWKRRQRLPAARQLQALQIARKRRLRIDAATLANLRQ